MKDAAKRTYEELTSSLQCKLPCYSMCITLDSYFSLAHRSCFRKHHSMLDKGRERTPTSLYYKQFIVNYELAKCLFSNSSGLLHAKVVDLLV